MPEKNDGYPVPSPVLDGVFDGWLRDAMVARGISVLVLATRTGIDRTTVFRLATGAEKPTLATVVALLRVLAPAPTRSQFGTADEADDEAS